MMKEGLVVTGIQAGLLALLCKLSYYSIIDVGLGLVLTIKDNQPIHYNPGQTKLCWWTMTSGQRSFIE